MINKEFQLFILRSKLLLLFLFPLTFFSQDNDRLALVIGNSNYLHMDRLDNPVRDAELIASTLDSVGFKVMLALDLPNQDSLINTVYRFQDMIDSVETDVVLVYYAGHGVEINQEAYLLPTGIDIPNDLNKRNRRENYVKKRSLSVNDITQELFFEQEGKVNILILDACRVAVEGRGSFTFEKFDNSSVETPSGTFLAFSTSSGELADDGPKGLNSAYCSALSREILVPGQSIDKIFDRVTKEVMENYNQEPNYSKTGWGDVDFYFNSDFDKRIKQVNAFLDDERDVEA